MTFFTYIFKRPKKYVFTFILAFFATQILLSQQFITGKVLDNKQLPLVGVRIFVVDTANEFTTDFDGNFSFQTSLNYPVLLRFSFIGFETQEKTINSVDPITISLQPMNNQLDEIVVSNGYSFQKKTEITGAVATITSKQLENRPATSFDQLLGGQATGVEIIQPSSVLNNTPVLRIRGLNTITSGLFPLVVIDGVSMFVGANGGLIGNNPLSDINPNDIETIDVLKDASASAIYGSRAANGVIVITTKKGKIGKSKIAYDNWFSVSVPFNLPKLLNAEQYTMIKNEAMTNSGRAPGYALATNPNGTTVNTNWYDVAYQPGFSQNHNFSISGANQNTNYFFSTAFTNQNSFIKNNTFERLSNRLNIEHQLNNALKFGAAITYSNGKNAGPNTGAISSNSNASSSYNTNYITNEPLARMTYVLPPNVPVYNADGSYSIQNGISVGYGANNPATIGTINAYNLAMVQTLDTNTSENNTFIANVFGEYIINAKFKFKSSVGIHNLQIENTSFLNPKHGGGAASNGIATNTFSKFYRANFVNSLQYKTTFASTNKISVLIGHETIKTTTNTWGAQQSFVLDAFTDNFQGGYANIVPYGNYASENALLSYFLSTTFSHKKNYLLSFNIRRDGLSALAAGNKYGNFGGIAAAWNVFEEDFYRNTTLNKHLKNVKLRASYGVVGNSEIGDYPAIGTYNTNTYAGQPTLDYTQTANPNLQWENVKKLDFGLDFSLLNDKITVNMGYFNNQIDGLILKAPQSLSAGIPGNYINTNSGSMYNRGLELAINASIVNKDAFNWTLGINVSTLKNKVTSLPNDVFVPSVFGVQNMTREGYSIGSIFAVPCKGVNPDNGLMVFTNSEGKDVQYNHVGSPKWTYLDGSAAPAIDNYKDGVIQGPSLPKITGGINSSLAYKNFDLSLNFTFVAGNKLYNGTRATISDQRYFNNGTFILDRWTKPGDKTEIQKLQYGDNVSAGFSFSSTSKVENGDYLKLKNLIVGYTIPVKKIFLKDKISSARVYLQGGNLFTITKYRGSDPEVSINGNSINSGKDQNVPPNAQVFTAGLNVTF